MILVEISQDGIKKVFVRAECEEEQDRDLKLLWPVVRRALNRLNRELARREEERPEPNRAA